MVKEKKHIAVIGLGYVGLPLAVEFNKKYKVTGFDVDVDRVDELINGFDRTNELQKNDLKNLRFTNSKKDIARANIYIVTVPTPVDKNNKPDLSFLESASTLVGSMLVKNNIVIFESTVFPGCTEEVCVPILEEESGLNYNTDFFCGYSPERINPGDKEHTLTKIVKVVSGSNEFALNIVTKLYESIISAGVHKASSIAVAEAAKVIENTQRDVNIALMNELSLIFNKLNIDTSKVLEAASTKWNFIDFRPGLVGGHCIGVDPYYLTYKAIEIGYHPEIILTGRKINDNMGAYIAEKTISKLASIGINPIGAKVGILGLTFKENCPDLRNTKVTDIIDKLNEYQCDLEVSDPWAHSKEVIGHYNIKLTSYDRIQDKDVIILAVSHDAYKNISKRRWRELLKPGGLVVDVKSIYNKSFFDESNVVYWRL